MANKYEQALQVMSKYYQNYVSKMADEIVEKSAELQRPYMGHGEDIVDRYGHQLMFLSKILCDLKYRARPSPCAPPMSLAIEELRCPQEAVGEKLKEWLKQHPGVSLEHMEILQNKSDCVCLLVYRGPGAVRDCDESE